MSRKNKPKPNRPKMSFQDALGMVPDDMPDGAYFAMAEQISGMDLCDGIEQMEAERRKKKAARAVKCNQCNRMFATVPAMQQHAKDAHQATTP